MVKTYLADIKLLDALGMLQLHAVVCLCGWKCGAVVEDVTEGNAGKELSVWRRGARTAEEHKTRQNGLGASGAVLCLCRMMTYLKCKISGIEKAQSGDCCSLLFLLCGAQRFPPFASKRRDAEMFASRCKPSSPPPRNSKSSRNTYANH